MASVRFASLGSRVAGLGTEAFRGLHLRQSADLLAAASLAVLAALLASVLAIGDPVRLYVTLPIVLTAPGYLLIQALLVPARPAPTRILHALIALGVSPAVVGLLALSTAIVPGGFRPAAIIVVLTLGCLTLAAVAYGRRVSASTKPINLPYVAAEPA